MALLGAAVVAASPARSDAALSLEGPARGPATLAAVDVRSACPGEMVQVGASCIDRWEASLVVVHDDGSTTPHSPYESPAATKANVRAVSRPGVVPQAHISRDDARLACAAAGKRLCRANEWRDACRGASGSRYPYGNKRKSGACTDTGRSSPIAKLHGGDHSVKTMNDPRLNQQPNTVAPTGAAASCVSDYGVYDMVGNLHEWTDDGKFRGGYYLDTTQNNEGCDYKTNAHATSYYDYSTGFRCCADATE